MAKDEKQTILKRIKIIPKRSLYNWDMPVRDYSDICRLFIHI